MIKINLLPRKEIKKKAALTEQGTIAIVSIVVVLVVLVFLKVNVKGKVAEIDRQIGSVKSELEKLKKNEAEIEDLKASEQILQQKIDVIKQLEARKSGPVRMLDEIATKIPGKMWLTDLKSQGALLTLDGVAIDNETIAQFMTNLENSDQFDNVELKIAQETKIQELMLKKFSLTAAITGMKALEVVKAVEEAAAKGKAKGKGKGKKEKK
ncbi:MAG: PilN domain-containing protein [Pseudomonadota bacterium]